MNVVAIALLALLAQQDTIATMNDPRVGLKAGAGNTAGVAIANMRLVAHGPVQTVFTPENLRKTYGGRLNILEAAGEAVRARERSE